jgi:uncharacterized protein YbjT (DUF2867 family)
MSSRAARWSCFLLGCALIALTWLVLLPAAARHPRLRARIAECDARGINASAMYYTELDTIHAMLAGIDAFHAAHPSALWTPSPRRDDDLSDP